MIAAALLGCAPPTTLLASSPPLVTATGHTGDTGTGTPPPVGWGDCATLRGLSLLSSTDSTYPIDALATPGGGSLVAATFLGPLAVPGGPTLTPLGEAADALLRTGPDGPPWGLSLDGGASTAIEAIAATADGGAIVAADVDGVARLGGAPVGSVGSVDGLVIRVDAAGDVVWQRRIGSADIDVVHGVAVLPDGDVVAAGAFSADVTLDKDHALSLPAGAEYSAFVARWSPDGALRWVTPIGGRGAATSLRALQLDPTTGELVLFGTAYGTELTLPGRGVVPESEGFVLRVDGSGAVVDAFGIGLAGIGVQGLAAAPDGAVLVSGLLAFGAVFGAGQPGEVGVEPVGTFDGWVARYERGGALAWIELVQAADGSSVTQASVAVGADGVPIIAGVFGESVALRPAGGGVADVELSTVDDLYGDESFVATLAPDGRPVCVVQLRDPVDDEISNVVVSGVRARADGWVDVLGTLSGVGLFGEGTASEIAAQTEVTTAFTLTLELAR